MIPARADSYNCLAGKHTGAVHQDWDVAAPRAAIAQLTITIVTPRQECAVHAQRQAVGVTGRYGSHRLVGKHAGAVHQDRDVAGDSSLVAQLAVVVVTPSHESDVRPVQHEIIARAAKIVDNKREDLPIVR